MDPYFVLWNQADGEAMQHSLYDFEIDLAGLGISTPVTIRDLWRNADEATAVNGTYRVQVPYHGVKFIRIIPEK